MSGSDAKALSFPLSESAVAHLVRQSVPDAGMGDSVPAAVSNHVGAVVAIGAFDGVHLGHRTLIEATIREAREHGLTSVVVTFDPDPSELLAGEDAELRLLDVADRMAFFRKLGVDRVTALPFTPSLAKLSPGQFLDVVEDSIGSIASVHVGENFRFGHKGKGDVAVLRRLGTERGFAVTSHPLLLDGGQTVSSTRVRRLLAEGKVEDAARLLGRCHFVRGSVQHGRGEGTSFGFPTANVRTDVRSCMPAEGVYACVVTDGVSAWPAAANVGAPPTFDAHRDAFFLEANLLGFEGDLYGRDLAVVFVAWLRASRPFSSLEELERVVLGNIDWVRHNIGERRVEVCG